MAAAPPDADDGGVTRVWDAIILGAGASGLSLATRLARDGWADHAVLVVDDGTRDPARSSWAYWSAGAGPVDAVAGLSFRQVRVRAGRLDRVVDLGPYSYRVVRGTDLAGDARRAVGSAPRFEMRTGWATHVRDDPDLDAASVWVDGERLRARWVFDGVLGPRHGPAAITMAFAGWRVRTAQPCFDPRVPTLFDFRTDQAGEARFVYVLPDGPRDALVELTRLAPAGARVPTAHTGAAVTTYLRNVLGAHDFVVVGRESGTLSLGDRPAGRRMGHVLAIGRQGGLVKAGTGFAFDRIQRDSAAIAASLVRHGHPFDLPVPHRRHAFLDAVLLEAVAREPARLEEAFARLFDRNPAAAVLAFLDEDSGPRDETHIVRSLPVAPYAAAALRVVGRASARAMHHPGRRTRSAGYDSPTTERQAAMEAASRSR